MSDPTISAIIPCFNAGPFIGEAIASVLAQNIDGMEIIVVDDGSTDNSLQIVEEQFPSVRLVSLQHSGPSRARNEGLRFSIGRFIQYLDADDFLAAGKIRTQWKLLQQTGADIACGDWQEWVSCPSGKFEKGQLFKPQLRGLPEGVIKADCWSPPAVYLFRREIVQKAGEWKENLWMCEDVRFLWSCAIQGARFAYTPGVMAYYRVHPGQAHLKADQSEFIRGCFEVAVEAEQWFLEQGITPEQKQTLLDGYGHVARASFGRYPGLFKSALTALNRLQPGYIPDKPASLAVLSRLIGYQRAEELALRYRQIKRLWAG